MNNGMLLPHKTLRLLFGMPGLLPAIK